jgi:hypothetical protein
MAKSATAPGIGGLKKTNTLYAEEPERKQCASDLPTKRWQDPDMKAKMMDGIQKAETVGKQAREDDPSLIVTFYRNDYNPQAKKAWDKKVAAAISTSQGPTPSRHSSNRSRFVVLTRRITISACLRHCQVLGQSSTHFSSNNTYLQRLIQLDHRSLWVLRYKTYQSRSSGRKEERL